jgi:hypothetical protein
MGMPGAAQMDSGKDKDGIQPGADNANYSGNDAQYPNAGQEGVNNSEDTTIFSDPKKAEEEIRKLRAENAKHRTKNRELDSRLATMDGTLNKLKAAFGGEEEEVDPAEMAVALHAQNEALQVELGISQLAMEHGISGESSNYFRFLLAQRFDGLDEGEEVTEEDILGIVQEVQKFGGRKGMNSTGLSTDRRPNSDQASGVSVEAFAKMTVGEKTELFVKNEELYKQLFREAKEKRLI